METAYDGRQIVGMDLHRRRSVLVRMTEDGRRLGMARITNSPQELQAQIARAGTSPIVVLEATFGWYWAADTLAGAGAGSVLSDVAGERDCRGPVPGAFRLSRAGDRGHHAVLVIFLAQRDAERRGPRGERGPAGTARLGVGPPGDLGAVVADRPLQHGQALAVPAL